MGRVIEGMNPGIGTAMALDIQVRISENLIAHGKQGPLDGPGIGLFLPATIAGTGVLQGQTVTLSAWRGNGFRHDLLSKEDVLQQ
jgi:hypothetical protein